MSHSSNWQKCNVKTTGELNHKFAYWSMKQKMVIDTPSPQEAVLEGKDQHVKAYSCLWLLLIAHGAQPIRPLLEAMSSQRSDKTQSVVQAEPGWSPLIKAPSPGTHQWAPITWSRQMTYTVHACEKPLLIWPKMRPYTGQYLPTTFF